MRKTAVLFVMVGLVLLVACEPVVSVHPIYTEADLVTDARLLGCWTGETEEGPCLLTFTEGAEGDNRGYALVMKEDDGAESAFRAHLAQLGDRLYLDVQPVRGEESDTIHQFHLVAAHTFFRVRFEGEMLRLAMLDNEWLDDALAEGEVKLPHRRSSDENEHSIVLTASTEQLQRFVLKYADDEEAFTELDTFHRGKTELASEE